MSIKDATERGKVVRMQKTNNFVDSLLRKYIETTDESIYF